MDSVIEQPEGNDPQPAEAEKKPFPSAYKMAGGVLVLNGLFLILDLFLPGADTDRNNFSAILGSIVLGIGLIRENWKTVVWARVAVCIGAVVFTAVQFYIGETFQAVIQLIFSLSLINLLVGIPNVLRERMSMVVVLCYFVLQTSGYIAHFTGFNPAGQALGPMLQGLERIENRQVTGKTIAYRAKVPDDDWMILPAETGVDEENSAAQIWITHPGYDAHILFAEETLPDSLILDFNLYVQGVLQSWRSGSSVLQISGRKALQTDESVQGELVTATIEIDKAEYAYIFGFYGADHWGLKVVCFCGEASVEKLKDDFNGVIKSVQFEEI